MGPVSANIAIDLPRERVFGFLSDLANRPAFTDHFIHDLRLERLSSSGVGAAARFRLEPPMTRLWMETVIEEADAPHRIFERGRTGRYDRIPVFTVWELVGGPGARSEVRLSFWTEPSHPVDRLRERFGAERWYRRQWSRALERLKDVLESGREIERVAVAGGARIPV
jgi:Polyketide cyclase / dehydrase and lipid transport